MAFPVPTEDQMMGQLRTIIPPIGTIITVLGVPAAQAGSWVQLALGAVGPISYVIVAVWSYIANSRSSIMTAASKPGGPNMAAPQIVLPIQETALAASLPSNVNTTETKKVVNQ
jgi:hypothetical protein